MSLQNSFEREGGLLAQAAIAKLCNALNEANSSALNNYFNSTHSNPNGEYHRFTVNSMNELTELHSALQEQGINMAFSPHQLGGNNQFVCEIPIEYSNNSSTMDVMQNIAQEHDISVSDYTPPPMESVPDSSSYGNTLADTLIFDHLDSLSTVIHAIDRLAEYSGDHYGINSNSDIFNSALNADGSANPALGDYETKTARVINGDTVIVDGSIVTRESNEALYNNIMGQFSEREQMALDIVNSGSFTGLSVQEKNAEAILNNLYDQEFSITYFGDRNFNALKDQYSSNLFCSWSTEVLDGYANKINADAIIQEKARELEERVGQIANAQINSLQNTDTQNFLREQLENGALSYDDLMTGNISAISEAFSAQNRAAFLNSTAEGMSIARQLKEMNMTFEEALTAEGQKKIAEMISAEKLLDGTKAQQLEIINSKITAYARQEDLLKTKMQQDVALVQSEREAFEKAKEAAKKAAQVQQDGLLEKLRASGLTKNIDLNGKMDAMKIVQIEKNFVDIMSKEGICVVDKWGNFDENLFAKLSPSQLAQIKAKYGVDLSDKDLQEYLKNVGKDKNKVGHNALGYMQKGIGFMIKAGGEEAEGLADLTNLINYSSKVVTYTSKTVKATHKIGSKAADFAKLHSKKAAELAQRREAKKAAKAASDDAKKKAAEANAKFIERKANRVSKAAEKLKNSRLGRFVGKAKALITGNPLVAFITDAAAAIKQAATKVLIGYFTVAAKVALVGMILFAVINIVMALLTFILSIFNIANWFAPRTYKDTIAYNLYTTLTREENMQYRDVTNMYFQARSYGEGRGTSIFSADSKDNYMGFGYDSDNPDKYIENAHAVGQLKNLEYTTYGVDLSGDQSANLPQFTMFMPNPFWKEGYVTATQNSEYLSRTNPHKYTGTVSYSVTTNANNYNMISDPKQNYSLPPETVDNGHTSNIKDIIAMVDVMYQMEAQDDDDGAMGSILGKSPAQYDIQNFFDTIGKFFVNIFKAIGNFFKWLFGNPDYWEIKRINVGGNSYGAIQNYAMTLFEVSHQKSVYLGVEYGDYHKKLKSSDGGEITFENKHIMEYPYEETAVDFDKKLTANFLKESIYGNNIKPENVTPESSMEFGICDSPVITPFPIMLDTFHEGNNADNPEPYIKNPSTGVRRTLNDDFFEANVSMENNLPSVNKGFENWINQNGHNPNDDNNNGKYWCLWKGMPKYSDIVQYTQFDDPEIEKNDAFDPLIKGVHFALKEDAGKKWWDKIGQNRNGVVRCWSEIEQGGKIVIKKKFKVSGLTKSDYSSSPSLSTYDFEGDAKKLVKDKVFALAQSWLANMSATVKDFYVICGYCDANSIFADLALTHSSEGDAKFYDFQEDKKVLEDSIVETHLVLFDGVSCDCPLEYGSYGYPCAKCGRSYCSGHKPHSRHYKPSIIVSGEAYCKWADLVISTTIRKCKKHFFEYCGGHISCTTNLNVFSMTNEQLGLSGGYDDGAAPIALNLGSGEVYSSQLYKYLDEYAQSQLVGENGEDISPLANLYPQILGKLKDREKEEGGVDYSTVYSAITTGGGFSPGENIFQGTTVSKGLNLLVTSNSQVAEWDSGIGIASQNQEKIFYTQLVCPQCKTKQSDYAVVYFDAAGYDYTTADKLDGGKTGRIECMNTGCGISFYYTKPPAPDTNSTPSNPEDYDPQKDKKAKINECRDIFDIDSIILKGDNVFKWETYTDYTGWTETNMEMAINRFAIDWYETYSFDVSQELGYVNMRLSNQDIELLAEGLCAVYPYLKDSGRLQAIKTALFNVGRGHCYFPDGKFNEMVNNPDYAYLSTVRYSNQTVETKDENGNISASTFFASSTTGTIWDFYAYIKNHTNRVMHGSLSVYNTPSFITTTSGVPFSTANLMPGDFIFHEGYDYEAAGYVLDTTLFSGTTTDREDIDKAIDGQVLKDFYCRPQALMYIGTITPYSVAKMRDYYKENFYSATSHDGASDDENKQSPEEVREQMEQLLESMFPSTNTKFKLSFFAEETSYMYTGCPIFIDLNQVSLFSGVALRYKAQMSDSEQEQIMIGDETAGVILVGNEDAIRNGSMWHHNSDQDPYAFLDINNKNASDSAGQESYYTARGEVAYSVLYPWVENAMQGNPDSRTKIYKPYYE